MDKKLTVAAAQLGEVSEQYTRGISAEEVNYLFGTGNWREAEKLLDGIEVYIQH